MPRAPSRTCDIRISTAIKAEPGEVYRALTSARELCLWWLDRAETEARNMGRFRMVWPAGVRGNGSEAAGVFADLEPGSKVALALDAQSRPRGMPALVSIFIEAKPKGAELTLIHAGFSASPSRRRLLETARESWEDGLAKLRLYLESGKTCKSDRLTFADLEMLLRPPRRRGK